MHTDPNQDINKDENKHISANTAAIHSRSQHALVFADCQLSALNTVRIVLLTHDTELCKASNTAGLAFDVLAALRCIEKSGQDASGSVLASSSQSSSSQSSSSQTRTGQTRTAQTRTALRSLEQSGAVFSASETSNIATQPQLVQLALEQVVWQRKASDHHSALRRLMAPSATPRFLLFPAPHASIIDLQDVVATHLQIQQFMDGHHSQPIDVQQQANMCRDASLELIILDATWQRARKMYRQSPYLQQLPTWQFCHAPASQFARRRNQVEGGWCTAEMIAMVWQLFGCDNAAMALQERFAEFNQR
jgi:DTW domain-containing protein YfiP